jgi:hypothetical protein
MYYISRSVMPGVVELTELLLLSTLPWFVFASVHVLVSFLFIHEFWAIVCAHK